MSPSGHRCKKKAESAFPTRAESGERISYPRNRAVPGPSARPRQRKLPTGARQINGRVSHKYGSVTLETGVIMNPRYGGKF